MSLITMQIRSILIIQTKFIGDLILTSALSRNLQIQFPEARIVYLCAEGHDQFLLSHGIANEVVTFERSALRGSLYRRARELHLVTKKLRSFNFDLTIDVTDSKTSRVVSGLVNAPIRVGYNPPERPLRRLERQPATVFAKPYGYGGRHFLDRYLSPLEALGLKQCLRAPSLPPVPEAASQALTLLARHGLHKGDFVAVHAGSSFAGRCWQPERFAIAINEIGNRAGTRFVLVGSPSEKDRTESIHAVTNSHSVNLAGEMDLIGLFALLAQSRLFLGNESGPMHMAAAAGVPVVGLFGLTDPERWGPVGVPSRALRPSMPCPCIAPGVCNPKDPSRAYCVWRLEVAEVVEAVCGMLKPEAKADGS